MTGMNARENPFASHRVLRARYRLTAEEWGALCLRLQRLNYRAAIVGPFGHGKTTLMEDLAPRLQALGFGTPVLKLTEERRFYSWRALEETLKNCTARDILLLDDADVLGLFMLRWVRWQSRRFAGLIVATHAPCGLPELIRCETSPELLEDLIGEIVTKNPEVFLANASNLFKKHQGNLRDALRELYDCCAQAK
jgi:hypothetical protein